MNILLATGEVDLDEVFHDQLKNVKFVGDISYREGVVELVQLHKPDIIIMSELLDGNLQIKDLLLTLRFQFSESRIIFLLKEEKPEMRRFLYDYHIFDVLPPSFTIHEVEDLLARPRTWDDVKDEMLAFQKIPRKELEEERNLDGLTGINGSSYSPFGDDLNKSNNVEYESIAFWSPLHQSGKTISAANAALTLANNPNLKILLVDLNLTNPNINLYYSFVDPDRNLAALLEDYSRQRDDVVDSLSSYFIQHPTYHNLSILPGHLLRRDQPSTDVTKDLIDDIIQYTKNNGYTTVLFDMEAGLYSPIQSHILNSSTKILFHITETPGSFNATNRLFDNLYGPFVRNLIDKEKIIPIITQSHEDTFPAFKLEVEKFFSKRVILSFEYSNDIRLSTFKGEPIMREMPPEELYDKFIILANLIHENSFIRPIKPQKVKKQNKKEKGRFFWSKKD
ncbi:hypothetical protein bcgnr5390_14770 [Bacillus luti]|nr:hypothetical protein BC2903_46800 [Bacillus cereus]